MVPVDTGVESAGLQVVKKNARFYGVNILSELDEGSEYFIDEKAQKLYFMPPEGQPITAKPVTLSVNHSAVVGLAAGTAHVQFTDLTVGFGRSTGVAATTVDNVLVDNCTVRLVVA